MEQTQSKCTGNCLNCLPAQRAYCASQHAYSNMKVLDAMMNVVLEMKGTIDELKTKVEGMQDGEVVLFDPNEDALVKQPAEPIAQ